VKVSDIYGIDPHKEDVKEEFRKKSREFGVRSFLQSSGGFFRARGFWASIFRNLAGNFEISYKN
jgi:hypothetical protein